MHYITLRALAALAVVFIQATLHALAQVEEPTLTTSTTSTTIFSTHWVVVTSAAGTASTYTTSGTATGSTIGITTVIGSRTIHKPIPTHPPATSINMVWEGRPFQDAVLNSTNYYREQHEANPLTWDVKLATYAQSHADDCAFEHSGGSHGENLAQGYPSPALAIDAWANEETDYDYEKRQFSQAVGHFTQLVWKNTTAVGCGAADCSDKGWLLVCEYDPAGNVVGDFGGNVGKPGQGEDGEPGMGGAAQRVVCVHLLVALVAVSILAGLYA